MRTAARLAAVFVAAEGAVALCRARRSTGPLDRLESLLGTATGR